MVLWFAIPRGDIAVTAVGFAFLGAAGWFSWKARRWARSLPDSLTIDSAGIGLRRQGRTVERVGWQDPTALLVLFDYRANRERIFLGREKVPCVIGIGDSQAGIDANVLDAVRDAARNSGAVVSDEAQKPSGCRVTLIGHWPEHPVKPWQWGYHG